MKKQSVQAEPSSQNQHLEKGTLPRLLLVFGLFLLPMLLFMRLALEVRGHEQPRIDGWLLDGLHSIATPVFDQFFVLITTLGDALVVAPAVALVGGIMLYKKRRRAATLLFFSIGGAAIMNVLLKFTFQRPRPDMWHQLVIETGFSFPSGHAMTSSALAVAIMALCWHTRWRWLALSAGGFYIALVGVSRLYLGVHFPTDIVAGWCVSFAWVLLVKLIIDRFGTSAKAFLLRRWPAKVQ